VIDETTSKPLFTSSTLIYFRNVNVLVLWKCLCRVCFDEGTTLLWTC